jgi:hypothetical protein
VCLCVCVRRPTRDRAQMRAPCFAYLTITCKGKRPYRGAVFVYSLLTRMVAPDIVLIVCSWCLDKSDMEANKFVNLPAFFRSDPASRKACAARPPLARATHCTRPANLSSHS